MKAFEEWTRIYKEEGEANYWASIGASAILTALVIVVMLKVLGVRI